MNTMMRAIRLLEKTAAEEGISIGGIIWPSNCLMIGIRGTKASVSLSTGSPARKT
jgi:hypothetical protein